MIKRAFTVLELAIVLVIIGILFSMIFKAKEMINAANIRKDVSKISYLRQLIYNYMAENGTLPPLLVNKEGSNVTSIVDMRALPYLREIDYKSSYSGNLYFNMIGCVPHTDNIKIAFLANTKSKIRQICSSVGSNPDFKTQSSRFPRRLSCSFEVIMDDESLSSGDGRYTTTSKSNINMNFNNCAQEKGNHPYAMYLY